MCGKAGDITLLQESVGMKAWESATRETLCVCSWLKMSLQASTFNCLAARIVHRRLDTLGT